MLTMDVPVTIESVRPAKDDGSGYADFTFNGGNVNLRITADQGKQLSGKVGKDAVCTFRMKTISVIMYKRSVSVFQPVDLVGIKA
ncbi:MAG: hypothetical protein PHE96_11290 [Methylococcales bacterium]|nr:hypothetical protein [Methylococcales bacterium]